MKKNKCLDCTYLEEVEIKTMTGLDKGFICTIDNEYIDDVEEEIECRVEIE